MFLIGSSLFSENPNDLDIVLVYPKTEMLKVLRLRKELLKEFKIENISLDMLLLTKVEFEEINNLADWKKEKLLLTKAKFHGR